MRKEVIYAVIAGISIGLLVAFGAWKISKIVKRNPQTVIKRESPKPQPTSSISIYGLKNFDVTNVNPIIKGITTPNTDILISTTENDYYTKSNSEGEFNIEIELPSGLSEVNINNQKLMLVYSTEVESGSVSYVGTITDISSGTIQIKNNIGSILQISVNDDTKYTNTLKKNIGIKESDLAIGDYIIAIGNINNSKVLQTKKILVGNPAEENKYEFKKITIEKLTKTMINDITLPKKWNGPNIKDLEIGQEIYIVGTQEEKTYTLRSIFVNNAI